MGDYSSKYFSKKKTAKTKIYKFFNLEVVIPRKKKSLDYRTLSLFGMTFRFPRTKRFQSLCEQTEIVQNKIVFSNFVGKGYGCNPKYIAEQIIKEDLDYELVWLVTNPSQERINFPEKIRLVNINSRSAFVELASAKIWIDNSRKNQQIKRGLIKKRGQFYIQTWHGSLGIKKLDADVVQFQNNTSWIELSKRDASLMDFVLINSEFERRVLTKALWFENEVKAYGHPRNDVFFKEAEPIKEKVYKYYGIERSKKLVLYVPSFRDNKDLSWFKINYESVLLSLSKRFGGEWVFVLRLHPRVKMPIPYKDINFVDATNYPDIQELLVASDVAISDYSSCIYDFLLTRRPGFLYAPDIKKYDDMRGFYYPLECTPFPVSQDNSQLIQSIENFNLETFSEKCENFLSEKGCHEDGHASERVVNLIKSLMQPGNNNG